MQNETGVEAAKPKLKTIGRPLGTYTENSRLAKLSNLDVGETYTESIRLSGTQANRANIRQGNQYLKNCIGKAMNTAKLRTGHVLTMEIARASLLSGDTLLVLVITRQPDGTLPEDTTND